MSRIVGLVLSVAGVLIATAAIVIGGYNIVDNLVSPGPQAFVFLTAAATVLGAAFGIGLRIIGKHLSGLGGVLFPRLHPYLTSGSVIVAEMIGAAGLWGLSAWFTFYLLDLVMHKPRGEISLDLLLGIPFGVLIPLGAGFALYAASRIPNAPADANAAPPPEAVRMLGNAFMVFGIFWLVFAGSCTWTGGFNSSGPSLEDASVVTHAILSLLLGATAVAVGVWLRRISYAPARTAS